MEKCFCESDRVIYILVTEQTTIYVKNEIFQKIQNTEYKT